MVVSRGIGGNGLCGAPPHQSIHKETVDNNSGKGDLMACIFTVHDGGENVRQKPYGALVGSRRGKKSGEINEDEM